MNKLSIAYLTLIIATFLFGCGEFEKNNRENAPTSSLSLHVGNDKYMMIDTKASVVTWKGSSLNGLNTQTGYVYLSKGELLVENSQLVGGTVEIDMNTIEDKYHGQENKLVDHLKDPDFFEVEKFPFVTLMITKVAPLGAEKKKVTGNLTIKGITHPVTFPAQTIFNKGTLEANARLVIDRTRWNVRYKSARFYANLLANQTMSDSIEFHVKLLAKNRL